jgi:hypothetical protein
MVINVSGFTEMSGAVLFDLRRNRCAASLFDMLLVNHTGSFSAAVGNAGRQAAHRLFGAQRVKPADMLSGHVSACIHRFRELCGADDYLLIASDTTDFDFSGHTKTDGLGSVGIRRTSGKGLQSHGGLAMTPDGMPLGVVYLDIWPRVCAKKGLTKAEKKKINDNTPKEEKESYKWLKCILGVQKLIASDVKLLFIQDREADMFDLFIEPRRTGVELLVRAAQPRCVEVVSNDPDIANSTSTVFKAVQSARALGQITVKVNTKPDREERMAVLDVRCCRVFLQVPMNDRSNETLKPQEVWLVSAREVDAPDGAEPVDWTLITTIQCLTFADACRIVTFYTRRWLIERLHFVLKSGLKAEGLRFDDADSLSNALAMYYMVAWRLLHLTYVARLYPDQPASNTLEQLEVEILSQVEKKRIITIAAAVTAIAKLGGYTYYRNAAPPGAKTIWLGLRKLEGMLAGYRLAMAQLKDVNH